MAQLCNPSLALTTSVQVDPAVSAIVHYVRSLYYKYKKSFADFYKASLLYLAFISSDSLPQEQKLVSSALAGRHASCFFIQSVPLGSVVLGFIMYSCAGACSGHFIGSIARRKHLQFWGAASPSHRELFSPTYIPC